VPEIGRLATFAANEWPADRNRLVCCKLHLAYHLHFLFFHEVDPHTSGAL
jgi:hypothetical protein